MARRRKPKWELIIHADLESKFNEYNLFTKERQDILDHLHELEMNPFMHGSKNQKNSELLIGCGTKDLELYIESMSV